MLQRFGGFKKLSYLCSTKQKRKEINMAKKVDDAEMEVRITFRSEVYIKGKTLEEIKSKWENIPIFSADALETYHAEYIELCSSERVDDDSYEDVNID